MVEFPSDEPNDQDNPQDSEEEMEKPQESGEEMENPQAESIEKTLELSDDVAAQESQVKESDESSPIVSGLPSSSSAINEDNVDRDDPQESDEDKENPEEESIEKTPELSDDVVAQEPQVNDSDESSPIVSSLPSSSSAINEDNVDQDDPQESDEDKENPEEDSIEKTPELCDDVVAQEPQVKDSDESTPIVSDLPASSSAINETELTETVEATYPSSSRKGKEIGYNDDDSEDSEFPYRDETSSLLTLSTLSLHQNPNRSSETEMSQVMVLPQEHARLGGLDPQCSYQISRSDPMVNQQQQFIIQNQPFVMQQPLPTMMLPTQPRPFVVDHNYGAGFGPMSAPLKPPTITPQGPRNIYPSFTAPLPHMLYAMTPPIVAVRGQIADQPSGMQHEMDTDPNIVQARALCQHLKRLEDNPQYQNPTHLPMIPVTNEQNRIVAYVDPGPPPMMPMTNQNVQMRPITNEQNQIVGYIVNEPAPMMYQHVQMRPEANQQDEIAPNFLMNPGTNQQNQNVPYLAPGQAPVMHQYVQMRPEANKQEEVAPYLLIRPENNQQNQIVPYLAPGQAPMMQAPMMQAPTMPRMYQQVQMRPEANQVYNIVPNLHMRPITNQQNQIVAFQGPRMRVMYQRAQMRPEANQQYQNAPNLLPVASEQNQIFVPYVEPGLAPDIPFEHVMIGETIQQNQTNIFVYPGPMMHYPQQQVMSPQMFTMVPGGLPRAAVVNMIDQASSNVAAAAARPEHNQQQMLQLQSQEAQQTTQSQGFHVGSSSNQSQD